MTVVTSDRELADDVSRLGARVQSAEDMAAQLRQAGADTSQREKPPSPEEVEEWLALFGNDEDQDGALDPY